MKIIAFFCLLFVAVSCSEEPKKEQKEKEESTEQLEEYKNGIYTKYYPGKKKIQIRGAQDAKKVRSGKWVLLSPTGKEMSVTYFEKGLREGYSFVKHPTGTMNYYGEYLHDKQIGIWKYYDDKGNFLREENYGSDGQIIR
jgi:antitoxin component YwqK of YwqJK toxin-antitoxin module